jgi:hypothetical protein
MAGPTFRSVARQWLVANLLSLIVAAGIRLLGLGVDQALANLASRPLSETNWVTVEVLAVSLQYLTYGYLTAHVLRQVVAGFPASAWLTVHFVLGVVVGLFFGVAWSKVEGNESIKFDDTGLLIALVFVVLLGGGLIGGAIGSLQALVMRQGHVRGLKPWIAASAVAGIVQLSILIIATPSSEPTSSWGNMLHSEAVGVLAGLIAAVVMIPALKVIRT